MNSYHGHNGESFKPHKGSYKTSHFKHPQETLNDTSQHLLGYHFLICRKELLHLSSLKLSANLKILIPSFRKGGKNKEEEDLKGSKKNVPHSCDYHD